MSFIFLLIVSLSSLVRLEVQVTTTAENNLIARRNALYGFQEALGQLQKYLGPDMAVSAPASILDGDLSNSVDEIDDVVQPDWVGVWSVGDAPGQSSSRSIRVGNVAGAARAWLVSGAESDASVSPLAGLTGTSVQMASAKASLFDPGVSHPAVEVPKVPLERGAYAYWISDEGTKANMVPAPLPSQSTDDLLVQTSLKNVALEMVGEGSWSNGDFSGFVSDSDDEVFGKLCSLSSASLLPAGVQGAGFEEVVNNGLHDVTASSIGLLTNPRTGGLKKDLSALLAAGAVAPSGRIFSNQGTGDSSPGGPTWAQLQDYMNLASDPDYVNASGELIPRIPSADQLGISPVIARIQYFHGGLVVQNSSNGEYFLRLFFMPSLVLWNPYSLPIQGQSYYLELLPVPQGGTAQPIDLAYRFSEDSLGGSESGVVNFCSAITGAQMIRLEIKNPSGLEPGQLKAFSVPLSTGDAGTVGLSEGFNPGDGFFVDVALPASLAGKTSLENPRLKLWTNSYAYGIFVKLHDHNPSDTNETALKWIAPLRRIQQSEGILSEFTPIVISENIGNEDPEPLDVTGGSGSLPLFGILGLMATPERSIGPYNELGSEIPWLGQFNPTASTYLRNYVFSNSDTSKPYRLRNFNPLYQSSGETQVSATSPNYVPNEAIGFSDDRGNGGASHVVLVQFPDPDLPPHSLGELQHALLNKGSEDDAVNSRVDAFRPVNAIGNSISHGNIPSDAVYRAASFNGLNYTYYDSSYLLNEALWDDYFLSSIDPVAIDPVPVTNQRLYPLPVGPGGAATSSEYAAAVNYGVHGALNVNSTSVQAWKALLGAFMGVPVETDAGTVDEPSRAPVLRLNQPLAGEHDAVGGDAETARSSATGFRALSQDQVEDLAVQIVRQVKARGPFLDLASFVNRSIDSDAAEVFRHSGAIQSAIDETVYGTGSDQSLNDGFDSQTSYSGLYPDDDSMNIPMGWGMPGFLTQADVLARIGHMLTARSDTFKIRIYGEANDALGNTVGRAYGEGLVQRLPEYIYSDENDPWETPAAGSDNERFGRRFVIVAFRWLNEDEI